MSEVEKVVFWEDSESAIIYGDWPEEFNKEYEYFGQFLGDPKEDYYQGMSWTTVIKRKADGKLFGFTWWRAGGKHGEDYYDSNGDEYGIEPKEDEEGDRLYPFVFLPVKEFTVTGYEVVKPEVN